MGWYNNLDFTIPFLFEFPRQHKGFRIKKNSKFDRSSVIHGFGSMGLVVLLFLFIFVQDAIMSGLIVFALGTGKEFEDGYREGWDWKDMISNAIGSVGTAFLLHHLNILHGGF